MRPTVAAGAGGRRRLRRGQFRVPAVCATAVCASSWQSAHAIFFGGVSCARLFTSLWQSTHPKMLPWIEDRSFFWVRRPGRDLTIVTYAAMVHASLDAAAQLAREGIEAEVVDLRTLLPLDRETIIESVRRTSKLLVVHEDTRTGGIAGEIAAVVTDSAFEDLDGPVRRVTSLDTPVPFSPPLEEHFLPNAERIAAAARDLARY